MRQRSLLRTLVTTLCGALLLACGGGSGLHTEQSNDISLEQDRLTFARPLPGRNESVPLTVRVSSAGALDLTIERIYLEGDMERCDRQELGVGPYDTLPDGLESVCHFLILEKPPLPKAMPNGDYAEVTLTFHMAADAGPLTGSTPTGRLVIESDATRPELRKLYVDLGVIGENPVIAATPEVIALEPDVPSEQMVLIRNVGSGTLTVDDIQLRLLTPPAMDGTGAVVDEITRDVEIGLPWAISESDTYNIIVKYQPFDDVADTAELVIKSNDATTPDKVVKITSQPLKGLLQVQPTVAAFELEPGVHETSQSIAFINNGERTVNVLDIFIEQPADDYRLNFTGTSNSSFPLGPGKEMDGLNVIYHPVDGSETDGRLVIVTDADNAVDAPDDLVIPPEDQSFLNQYKVVLVPLVHSLASVPATLGLDTLALDFSGVGFGDSDKQTFEIRNEGGAPLEITRIGLSTAADEAAGLATDPEFTLTSGGAAVTLAAGETQEVEVQFARAEMDTVQHFGAVVIESNAAGSPHLVSLVSNPPAN